MGIATFKSSINIIKLIVLLLLAKANEEAVSIRQKNPLNTQIGQRIQLSREQAGLTQEQLAEKLGLSTQFISTIERGIYGASLETIVKLCDVLDISSDWLLLGRRSTASTQAIAARLSSLSEEQLVAADRLIADLMLLLGK